MCNPKRIGKRGWLVMLKWVWDSIILFTCIPDVLSAGMVHYIISIRACKILEITVLISVI